MTARVKDLVNRDGVIGATVEIEHLGEVALPDLFVFSAKWWAAVVEKVAEVLGPSGARSVLHYVGYRVMKEHDSKGVVPMRKRGVEPGVLVSIADGVFRALGMGRLVRLELAGGEVREVCLATNPDLEGDGTARFVERALRDAPVRVTRLARGLPPGGQIEYQSAATLAEAFETRRDVATRGPGSLPPPA